MAVVRCKLAESFTVTQLLVPLNDNALPNFPAALHVALLIVPLFPFPETSLTVVPLPSLNPYADTNPEGGGGVVLLTDTEIAVLVVWLFAPSLARAVMLYGPPLATVVVSQLTE
jgi:hypothetical protein